MPSLISIDSQKWVFIIHILKSFKKAIMSILDFPRTHNICSMSINSFLEFRKQAYFYIKEKINTARLVLTDVTPAQLLTEDVTNDNPWAPDPRTLALISRSAFEIDDYWRIVDILHHRLSEFDRRNWRASYNALIVLEHLLTHGPKSVADEFQSEMPAIKTMENFQHVGDKGFNWGLAVRKKTERVLKLLEKGPLLEEARQQARKLTREIKGFGSFSGMPPSHITESSTTFARSRSQTNLRGNGENMFELNDHNQRQLVVLNDEVKAEKSKIKRRSPKKNRGAKDDDIGTGDSHSWNSNDTEGNSLLWEISTEASTEGEDHHFNDAEKQSRVSLLAKKED